ncbi:uncharacterized protein ACLA_037750 [Aspergillus clavatus NRRL 1]|uniref:Kinetochore protein mis14 n=1 Tax=Aspergillus clavatus (strain ATCC 1007 / CBS 513.65 / DSM 816 / NCTC 3887 / NRRL 1 / QM 1276 / 107) TaxID=344612 RepID=A1CK91_ASPCL|nr:uncharacterized protein ACLA_037750 [Aspergillus clavatus NRRL 1]EAW09565.1 conserved hypothetical protein [Aspergillus clavatus NRRL 1]
MSTQYRKIELQSPADFTYLHTNTIAASRQKLDLHLPPSANADDEPDPMRERVKDLVDEFITKTFTTASASISINGLDASSPQFPFPAAFTQPSETIEYEAYDTELAARVTALYAQLEALTTSVAQLRREAPARAARAYAEGLRKAIEEDDGDADDDDEEDEYEEDEDKEVGGGDVPMPDVEAAEGNQATGSGERRQRARSARWELRVPLGSERETERWRDGGMTAVYEDALRGLLRLQGEVGAGEGGEDGVDGNALASTLGKAERAGRAVEVVEKM